jgi:hypothetical protein
MTLCEFCVLQQADGVSTRADYTGREQLKQMASFFGIAGKELKRVLTMSESWTTQD